MINFTSPEVVSMVTMWPSASWSTLTGTPITDILQLVSETIKLEYILRLFKIMHLTSKERYH